ncbi:MAG: acyltransferase [Eubacterium sp.]|nr:acyltransferase [Eubacterium sp.]
MDKINNKKLTSSRNYGIDLLRMLAMAMVVMLHVLLRSKLIDDTTPLTLKYEVLWFIEIFCYCAVDCFVLISGYVCLNTKFRLSRIVSLWVQVAFYSVIFEIIYQIVQGSFDYEWLIRSFLPVTSNGYWFFTQYFVLSFLIPFLNKMVKSVTLKQGAALAGVLLFFLSFMSTVNKSPIPVIGGSGKDLFATGNGYTLIWLMAVYILGAVLKRFDESGKLKNIKPVYMIATMLACTLITWVIKYICDSQSKPIETKFIVNYISPFVVIIAVSLLIFFSKVKISSAFQKVIAFLSPAAFGVYIIHVNRRVWIWFTELVEPMFGMRLLKVLPCIIFAVLFVYIVCSFADILRAKMFKLIGVDKLCRKADNIPFVKKICEDTEHK